MEIKARTDVRTFIEEILEADWLYPKQMETLVNFYNPENKFKRLVAVVGMRAGKTAMASIVQVYETFKLITLGRPAGYYHLLKGQNIFNLSVAAGKDQSLDNMFSQVKARIDNSPWFQDQPMKEHHNEFIFPTQDTDIVLRCTHSNSSTLAGRTCKSVVFDELARFVRTSGRSSGKMVYETLSAATKTFKEDAVIVSISSVLLSDDFQMELYNEAKDDPRAMTILMPTWEFNPTITLEDLRPEFERDPDTAWRDFGCMPSSHMEVYMKEHDHIDACVDHSLNNWVDEAGYLRDDIEVDEETWYYLAGDPAFKNDSFGLAVVHRDPETGRIVTDLLHRFKPEKVDVHSSRKEVDTVAIKDFILQLNDKVPLWAFITDTWNFPETIQALEQAGLRVEQHVVKKKEYDYLKELLYTGRIRLPENEVLMKELKQLELIRGIKVDHPKKGSKDISDALANAMWSEHERNVGSESPLISSVNI